MIAEAGELNDYINAGREGAMVEMHRRCADAITNAILSTVNGERGIPVALLPILHFCCVTTAKVIEGMDKEAVDISGDIADMLEPRVAATRYSNDNLDAIEDAFRKFCEETDHEDD